MITPTQEVLTPLALAKVVIKDWITGGDAEYIDSVLMAGVEVKPDAIRKTASFGKFDTKVIDEQTHREIEKFIVSIDGNETDVLNQVLALPEEDYNFIVGEIRQRRNKKKVSEAPGQ